MKKILIFLSLTVLVFAKTISLEEFLSNYGNKNNCVFIIKDNLNKPHFIDKKEAKEYYSANLQSLQFLLKNKLQTDIEFQKIPTSINSNIYFVKKIKNNNKTDTVDYMIFELKKVQKEGLKLDGTHFNGKKFKQDIDVIIQKLQEYKKLN